jgi:hypothetical protein
MAKVRVSPENHFTRAFHDDPNCRSPMSWLTRNMKSLEAENGDQLHLWECMGCGALVLAGLAKDRTIVHHQLARSERTAGALTRLAVAEAARRGAEERVRVLTEAVEELLRWGVELDDARMSYLVVQVGREALAVVRAALAPATPVAEAPLRVPYFLYGESGKCARCGYEWTDETPGGGAHMCVATEAGDAPGTGGDEGVR